MRILLVNDDGVLSPGLSALRSAVADMGEITVVAPESPQSAVGRSITLHDPLICNRITIDKQFTAISVSGRPVDCVKLAIRELMDKRPELVLSGINAGENVGVNIFYSGTVAAAAEGAIMGIPAVAFSLAGDTERMDFHRAAGICRKILDRLLEIGIAPTYQRFVGKPAYQRFAGKPTYQRFVGKPTYQRFAGKPAYQRFAGKPAYQRFAGKPAYQRFAGKPVHQAGGPGELINVNLPDLSSHLPRGVKVVPQSTASITEQYIREHDEQGRDIFTLAEHYEHTPRQADTDVTALYDGYITITPLMSDMTDYKRLDYLQQRQWDKFDL